MVRKPGRRERLVQPWFRAQISAAVILAVSFDLHMAAGLYVNGWVVWGVWRNATLMCPRRIHC